MIKSEVVLSEDAEHDITEYIDFIIREYNSPLTALRNYEGLFKTYLVWKKLRIKFPSVIVNRFTNLGLMSDA